MILVVCGYGGHGKGTAASYLRLKTTLRYRESTSEAASHLVMLDVLNTKYKLAYMTAREAWEDRHAHRDKWAEEIWAYNETTEDYHEMLPHNDIIEGVRKSAELQRLKDNGLVDLVVWVDAIERKPREPGSSCQVSPADCDVILDNNRSTDALKLTLDTFIAEYLSEFQK